LRIFNHDVLKARRQAGGVNQTELDARIRAPSQEQRFRQPRTKDGESDDQI
jgi:hypothetical protein